MALVHAIFQQHETLEDGGPPTLRTDGSWMPKGKMRPLESEFQAYRKFLSQTCFGTGAKQVFPTTTQRRQSGSSTVDSGVGFGSMAQQFLKYSWRTRPPRYF